MQIPEEIAGSLDTVYRLSVTQTAAYKEHGYIYLPEVAEETVTSFLHKAISKTTEELFAQKEKPKDGGYSGYFMQVSNLWLKNEMARAFVLAKRFAGIAAQLMQVQGVRLYHDQALFKQHGGLPTPWHQDQFYWPVSSKNILTMWMPLTDCPREMGSMTFAKGSHLRGQLSSLPISSTSNDFFRKHITEQQYELETFDLRAGDVTFHSGWTLHCAGANNTLARRDVMTIIYYEDGAKVSVPANSYQQVDMEAFFPGCKPGDAAATQLNPLIHSTKGKLTNS